MKIRSFLILSFLVAVLLPSLIFSIWSYRDGVEREYAEVKDRHLLLARNLGFALDRYQRDLAAALDAVSASLDAGHELDQMKRLLRQLDMLCVLIVDKDSGRIERQLHTVQKLEPQALSAPLLAELNRIAKSDSSTFSDVTATADGKNVVYLVKDLGTRLAIGQISTSYLVDFGKNISFGEKGHAAIFDRSGNVISHPLPEWIASRKNLAHVSPVARMMRGETGIEEFDSPAAKARMIAGFTTLPVSGWGVMVPQPTSEIYDKVIDNQSSLALILAIALAATLTLGLFLTRSLSAPLERLAQAMKTSAQKRQLTTTDKVIGPIPFREIIDINSSYNVMVRRMTAAGKRIETLAYSDTVTGLPNRDRLQTVAVPILREAELPGRGGVIVLIDIDNFKEINDLHGHDVGDEFLKVCAGKLQAVTARLDLDPRHGNARPQAPAIVARIGGDEFIIMVQGLQSEDAIRAFLDDLRIELTIPSPDLELIANASASIGCARFPDDGVDVEDLIKRADIAMYHAKNTGKNRAQLYSPGIGTQSVAELRRDLLQAIEYGDLVLEYQPKVCARRRVIRSVEALVRWNHPTHGRFLPGFWIPAVSDSPAMSRLGEWVIERAMTDQKELKAAGHDLFVSVNIGSRHFVTPGFVESVEAIRRRVGFPSDQLEIEVTEDALFVSEERAIAVFSELHDLGYKISIDDFGKGYSNIARLANLPVDFLKIDRSIFVGAYDNSRVRAILDSTLAMARDLGCKTVAEGVETLNQAEFATSIGADCLQGYYFAQSMPIDALIDWLNRQPGLEIDAYRDRMDETV